MKAGGSFSSTKSFVRNSAVVGAIDTAGFNLSFSGANTAGFTKKGLGSLTMSNHAVGSITQTEGSLILPAITAGAITLQGGTLQTNGILATLDVSSSTSVTPLLDIGGPGPGSLTANAFHWSGSGNIRVNFGVGSGSSDLWAITGSNNSLPTNPASILLEFSNLGGATTGVDYPLLSFSGVSAPNTNVFAFAPDMAALGWLGTFKVSSNTVSVRFTAVPEPSAIVLAARAIRTSCPDRSPTFDSKRLHTRPAQPLCARITLLPQLAQCGSPQRRETIAGLNRAPQRNHLAMPLADAPERTGVHSIISLCNRYSLASLRPQLHLPIRPSPPETAALARQPFPPVESGATTWPR